MDWKQSVSQISRPLDCIRAQIAWHANLGHVRERLTDHQVLTLYMLGYVVLADLNVVTVPGTSERCLASAGVLELVLQCRLQQVGMMGKHLTQAFIVFGNILGCMRSAVTSKKRKP